MTLHRLFDCYTIHVVERDTTLRYILKVLVIVMVVKITGIYTPVSIKNRQWNKRLFDDLKKIIRNDSGIKLFKNC